MNVRGTICFTVLAALLFACGGSGGTASSVDPAAGTGTDTGTDVEPASLPPQELVSGGFVSATASAVEAPNVAANGIDGNLSSRWAALGKGNWIRGDLGQNRTVSGLRVSWYRGSLRKSTFQIVAGLPDGSSRTVYSGQSSGTTDGLELYSFTPVTARTLTLVVNGNTENDYANLWEMAAESAAPSVAVAAPNGSDDTAAFNAAIAAAAGGTVEVPGSGTYQLRAVAVNKAGTTIVCTGATPATLRLRPLASGDGSPILNVTAGNFTLRNCVLDGNRSAQPSGGFNDSFAGRSYRAAIKMDATLSGLTVDRSTFKNVYGAAIATRMVSGIRITSSLFQDDNFEAVFAVTTWTSGDPSAAHTATGFTFTGNSVKNARSHDGAINANGLVLQQYRTVDIENNAWDGFERNAMKLENCREGVVAGNSIQNGDLSWAGIGMQNGVHSMTVSGNTLTNVGTGIDTSLVVGGQFGSDTVDHLTIRDNTIANVHSGSMPDGIRLLGYGSAMTDITITGNVIRSVPRYGINVRQFTNYYPTPTFARVTIQNNQLTSAGTCSWFSGTGVPCTSGVYTPNTCG